MDEFFLFFMRIKANTSDHISTALVLNLDQTSHASIFHQYSQSISGFKLLLNANLEVTTKIHQDLNKIFTRIYSS